MKFEENNLIEKYLNKSLSEEELLLFKKRMSQDATFFNEVQLEEQLYEALDTKDWSLSTSRNSDELQEYKVLFENEDTDKAKRNILKAYNLYKKEDKYRKMKWILYSSAALFILFISISSLFKTQETNLELYSSYIDFSELPTLSTRSNDDTAVNLLKEAERLFENKEYSGVIEILKNHSKTTQKSLAIQYLYLGISYMELNQFEKAEKTFENLSQSNLIDGRMGIWYKALLYIKMKDMDKAKSILGEIISNRLYNHEKANALLQELD